MSPVCGSSYRPERSQHAEARVGRPHSPSRQVPGGEAAVARRALRSTVPVQPALL